MTAVVAKRPPGRPKTDPDVAEREALLRIAELASNILICLRRPGRCKYDSERQLQQWLKDDGIQFTTADLPHSLALLESLFKLVRLSVGSNVARSGWLPLAGPEPSEAAAASTETDLGLLLINAIIRVLGSGRCESEADLEKRLDAAGALYELEDLTTAVQRSTDAGRLSGPVPVPRSSSRIHRSVDLGESASWFLSTR